MPRYAGALAIDRVVAVCAETLVAELMPPSQQLVMTVSALWARSDRLARACLLTAAASAAIHIGTFAGLSSLGPGRLLFAFHIIGMVVFGAAVLRAQRHRHALVRRIGADRVASSLPSWVTIATAIATLYGLGLFASIAAPAGPGYPQEVAGGWGWVQDDAVVRRMTAAEYRHFFVLELRTFSSDWLFFSLIAFCVAYTDGERLRALHATGAVDEGGSVQFFLGWPKTLVWKLVDAACGGEIAVAVGTMRGIGWMWRLGSVVVQGSVLAIALRFAYVLQRRVLGRWLANVTSIVICLGLAVMLVASLAIREAGLARDGTIAIGFAFVPAVVVVLPAAAGVWVVFRALRRISGRQGGGDRC